VQFATDWAPFTTWVSGETVMTDLNSRSPMLPVSTKISSIVWQTVVPGAHIFTLTHGLFV
jgi:hypothetical protein